MIHARDSMEMQIDLISNQSRSLRGVFHCFTGTSDQAKRIIELDFFLGIGGILTYKKSNLDGVIAEIGLERVVLETDAPYLPPVPHRGQRNESSFLPYVVERLADICEVPVNEIERITRRNAMNIFN